MNNQEIEFPYSPFREAGDLIYISGQLPVDPMSGELDSDNIKIQTQNALKNLNSILENIGLHKKNVIKTTIFMTDMSEFMKMNEIYKKFSQRRIRQEVPLALRSSQKGSK